jgi:ElaB/YqjD/DUF883 family membrane-anchored ribosome-binding protein
MTERDDTFDEEKQALRDIRETLHAGGEDVADEARAAADDIRETAADVAADARRAAARTRRRSEAAAASAHAALDDAGEIAAETARETVGSRIAPLGDELLAIAEERIRDKPLQAVGVAALVGLVAGFLLRGSRS